MQIACRSDGCIIDSEVGCVRILQKRHQLLLHQLLDAPWIALLQTPLRPLTADIKISSLPQRLGQ